MLRITILKVHVCTSHTRAHSISLSASLSGAIDTLLGELGGERKAQGGLDLVLGERALLLVAHKLAGLVGNLVEDIRDELGRDAGARVHLLEQLVNVDREGICALLLLLAACLHRVLLCATVYVRSAGRARA